MVGLLLDWVYHNGASVSTWPSLAIPVTRQVTLGATEEGSSSSYWAANVLGNNVGMYVYIYMYIYICTHKGR